MKKTIYSITLLVVFILASNATALAQSGFEDLNMGDDSVYNGSDFSGGFSDGSFYFVNTYDTTGGFSSWSGFSASTISDSITRGYRNQYASITGSGHQNSKHYAVAYSDSKIRLGSTRSVTGFYITNTTINVFY